MEGILEKSPIPARSNGPRHGSAVTEIGVVTLAVKADIATEGLGKSPRIEKICAERNQSGA